MTLTPRGRWWYFRMRRGGRRLSMKLDVPVEGTPPAVGGGRGDAVFERSRGKAELRAAQVMRDIDQRESEEAVIKRLHEVRTGGRLGSIKLDEMATEWRGLRRKKRPTESYLAQGETKIAEFTSFIKCKYAATKEMADVTPKIAAAFMASQEARGVANKTYNNTLTLLRSVFHHLRRVAGIPSNPFEEIPLRDVKTIGRAPFSAQELGEILEKARRPEHEFIRPILIAAMCTAMRRGDCCQLQWAEVDLEKGFISVTTSKTGERVWIPIFPLLRQELAALKRTGPDVFPEQATMYRCNPDGVTYRVERLLKASGYSDEDAGTSDGRHRQLRIERKEGLRRASVRGLQSLRVTFVTLALIANVPEELVRKITGHTAVEIVREHYFKPGREAFREELIRKMPSLFSAGEAIVSPALSFDLIATQLKTMTADNWTTVRDALLQSLERGAT